MLLLLLVLPLLRIGRDMSVEDPRFSFPSAPSWKVGAKQNVLGTELVVYDPSTPKWDEFPQQVEWNLTSNRVFLFGPMTKFYVYGAFQKQVGGTGAWVPMVKEDAAKVMLAPNWYEWLIQEMAVYLGNKKITTNDEARHVWPFLNAYLMANMDKLPKSLLCPHPTAPGHCVPTKNTAWTITSAEWAAYGEKVFTGADIGFDYAPLGFFPFNQNSEFMVNGNVPCALPMSVLERLDVRFTFMRDQSHIFKKAADTNTDNYRFSMESMQLCVEEARLSANFDATFTKKSSRILNYPGVTKLMLAETVSANSMFHKTRFLDIAAPEGMFIFALPKDVIGGTYKFSSNTDGKIFRPLNLKEVSLSFDNEGFASREPNFGMVENQFVEVKQLFDHYVNPPFGMTIDPDKLSLDLIRNCGANSVFPHAYINLCNFASKNRVTPVNKEGAIMTATENLDILLKFGTGGATDGVTYFIYLFYSDVNQILDMKTKQFSSPYLKK